MRLAEQLHNAALTEITMLIHQAEADILRLDGRLATQLVAAGVRKEFSLVFHTNQILPTHPKFKSIQ